MNQPKAINMTESYAMADTSKAPPLDPADENQALTQEKLQARAERLWRLRVGGISLATGFAIWFAVTWLGWIPERVLPSPGAILDGAVRLLSEGFNNIPLYQHILSSLGRTSAGFVLGSLVGIPVGLVLGQSKLAAAAAFPYMAAIRPVPAIAYIPLVILWFGIGEASKIALIFIATFLYVALSVADGARAVRIEWLRACRSLGGSWFHTFRHVVLPGTLPQIMTALKVGATISWSTVVASELIAAQSGLGSMVMEAATFYRLTDVFIGIALIGLIGFLLQAAISFIEQKLVHWSGT